jgi:cysteine-rich repeat protein
VLVLLLLAGCPQGSFNPSTDDYQPSSGDTTIVSASSPSTSPTTSGPPFCGDGVIDGTEVCDDGPGNTQSPWKQTQTCAEGCMAYAGYCGDGMSDGPEVCDDGVDNSNAYTGQPHCNADCTAVVPYCGDGTCQAQENIMQCPGDCSPTCGDGLLQAGEVCDDGMDTASCDGDCTFSLCGDGYLNIAAGEECDDGNQDDTDACSNDCKMALCGDGVVQAGVEECDDGNQVDDDNCSNACIAARRVFVSADGFTPNNIKGVAGADMLCKNAAAATPGGLANPGNTWVAWLSDDISSPSTRVPAANKSFTGWYLLPTGTPVAKGWSALTSGTLVNPINVTEAGAAPEDPLAAWTNTKPDGTSGGADHCLNWTNLDQVLDSGYGDITATSAAWTQAGTIACNPPFHLYCLEVSP